MKKPVVDYREFRFSKLNDPQFSHLKYLLGWVGYFILYFLTEMFIPVEKCYVVHSRLDDVIPFCEFFIVPYVGWYLLVIVSLLYFALYNPKSFVKFQTFIIITQIIAMTAYIFFPTMQDLRPTEFPRDNIFTDIVRLLYTVDTNTNVCPSLHVGYSIAIASAWLKEKQASVGAKAFVTVFAVLVCMSTAIIKQHSVIDTFVAVPMCLFAEIVVYKDYWKEKFKRKMVTENAIS